MKLMAKSKLDFMDYRIGNLEKTVARYSIWLNTPNVRERVVKGWKNEELWSNSRMPPYTFKITV